jgi:hypothetical protein
LFLANKQTILLPLSSLPASLFLPYSEDTTMFVDPFAADLNRQLAIDMADGVLDGSYFGQDIPGIASAQHKLNVDMMDGRLDGSIFGGPIGGGGGIPHKIGVDMMDGVLDGHSFGNSIPGAFPFPPYYPPLFPPVSYPAFPARPGPYGYGGGSFSGYAPPRPYVGGGGSFSGSGRLGSPYAMGSFGPGRAMGRGSFGAP